MAQKEAGLKAEQQLAQVFMKLADEVHPVALGRIERARAQIQDLATKLLLKHMANAKKIKKIVRTLCTDAGSHDYAIYRNEARNQLGLAVETPSPDLYILIKSIYEDFRDEMALDEPYNPAHLLLGANQRHYNIPRVLVETQEDGGYQWIRTGTISKSEQEIRDPTGNVIQTVPRITDDVESDKWERIT